MSNNESNNIFDNIIELDGIWFARFGSDEKGAVYFSYDRAVWERYDPERFRVIVFSEEER